MARFHRKDRLSRTGRPLPRLWLFTDERVDEDALFDALARLPGGSGVVFRHYRLPSDRRRALLRRIGNVARRRGLLLFDAGSDGERSPLQLDGVHRPGWAGAGGSRTLRRAGLLLSMPAHDRRDLVAARRAGADIVFLSPVFSTRSHPGAAALGPIRFGLLTQGAGLPVIALGGMDAARFRRVRPFGAHGWAAIDALSKGGATRSKRRDPNTEEGLGFDRPSPNGNQVRHKRGFSLNGGG
ncbi:hypothetical protein GCM10007897_10480 [Sphingobium jiangsuense]|nr:hypothetical protein GCM10007897_10480 [Sphingobium jiangsuense]